MPIKEFEDSKESIYHNPWSLSPLNLLGWSLRQLGANRIFHPKLTSGQFIVRQNIEDAAKGLIKQTEKNRGRVERIYSREQFAQFASDLQPKELSNRDVDLLLRFLQRDKGYLVYDSQTVKLIAPGETATITQEDSTIANLKSLIADLEGQIKVLEKKIDELAVTAREAVSRKNKLSALATLRSKKLSESTLSKRHATLSLLEDIFLKIGQASNQVELVRTMESSAKLLGRLNKEVGGVERVDEVLDNLREQMGQVDEVGNIIGEVSHGGTIDESEVDDELERMENEERKKMEESQRRAREEKDEREGEETRRKFEELGEIERRAKEATRTAEEREGRREDLGLEESLEGIKRMSLDPPEHATA